MAAPSRKQGERENHDKLEEIAGITSGWLSNTGDHARISWSCDGCSVVRLPAVLWGKGGKKKGEQELNLEGPMHLGSNRAWAAEILRVVQGIA